MLTPAFIEEMKSKLLQAKSELEAELAGMSAHTEMGDDEDENADEVEQDIANEDVMARIKHDLANINAALGKIESGTYGTDAEGKEISEERLRALPWADKAL